MRDRLDNSVFDAAASRTFGAVENYFNPMLELISSAVLWGEIGEIDSIGDPEKYIQLMQARLKTIGTVSSFSMTDLKGEELVIQMPGSETPDWYVTGSRTAESLSSLRQDCGIEYMSLDQMNLRKISGLEPKQVFRISTPYMLPFQNVLGITLCLEAPQNSDGLGLTLCLDLPLNQISERLRRAGTVKEAVIFILMPSKEDFIFLPVEDLLRLDTVPQPGNASEIFTPLEGGANELVEVLSLEENTSDKVRFTFTYSGKTWLAEFMHINIGNEIVSMGTLVPEEALWTTQVSGPLQIFLLALLSAAAFLVFRLVHDYRNVTQSPARVEEILREEITGGETFHLEFKSSLRWDCREDKVNKDLENIIVKSVAAFNNADGGTLLIGVADNGEILGIEKDYSALRQQGKDYFEIHLRNLLSSKYGVGYTSKNIAVDFPWLSGHEICRIRIRRGRAPLYTVVKAKNGAAVEKFFVRSGNTSQVLENISEITDYIFSRFSRKNFSKQRTKSV